MGRRAEARYWQYFTADRMVASYASLYDELMLSLHDTAKLDDAFQKSSPHQKVEFPPGSCWLVFTDMVLHAAMGGEFALEQTFHLDVDQMAQPERAPIKVLERLSGKSLA